MKKSFSQKTLVGLLVIQTVGLLFYTYVAMSNDGLNFLLRATEFVTSMTWMGQFSLDFQCYLILSTLWIIWRNNYSLKSIMVGVLAMVLGIIVFAPYLIFLIQKERGDLIKVLVGDRIDN